MKQCICNFFSITLFLFAGEISAQWQSALLKQSANGNLTYHADADGYILPDFSHAGYKGGGVAIPDVPVVKTIAPISGDNTAHIQAAIDYVGNLPKDVGGFRGALLLSAGKYQVKGTLYLKYDGVVIRGVGREENETGNTIITAPKNETQMPQRDVIILGNTTQVWGKTQLSATKSNITDDIVPVGSCSFGVTDVSPYTVGDHIIIYHPCTQDWINAVNRGGVPYPDPSAPSNADERWNVDLLPIVYNRYITAIDGNKITIDAPVFYTLNKSLSQSYVYKANWTGLIYQVGIENIRIEIENDGGTDEAHAWQAVHFKSVENAWARHCTMKGFGQSGIITEACTRSTFEHCDAIDPVAIVTGKRMYNFNTHVYSQLNLFRDNYASNGRHHFVSNGASSTSGNVFLRCTSDAINSVNEGHRQWTQGMLYDNHKEINLKRDFVLGLYNRVAMGTGHGWAAVQSVLWNCDVGDNSGKIGLQKPPTSQNYAIGCKAKTITGNPVNASNFTKGYVEGQNQSGLQPESLYEAQLAARLNNSSDGIERINTDFSDGTWGTLIPTPSTNMAGNYTTREVNGFKLTNALLYAGSIVCELNGNKHSNCIVLDKKNNGGALEFPTLTNIAELEIHVNAGTEGNAFVLQEYINNAWVQVGTPYATPKLEKIFTIAISRAADTKLRIVNNSGGGIFIYKIVSRTQADVDVVQVLSATPATDEVCFYNLIKEIKLTFNKSVKAGVGSLTLNDQAIELSRCIIAQNQVTIPVTLVGTPGSNKAYTLTVPAGAFLGETSNVASEAFALPFYTFKTVSLPQGFTSMIDVFYSLQGPNCRMDLYLPPNTGAPTPVVLNLHGGGWNHGYKEEQSGFNLYFGMGYAVANVEYRMTGEAFAPAAIEDVRSAIIYLINNASTLNIDVNKIVVQGGSAGGHLALIAGYLQNDHTFDTTCLGAIPNVKIMAVIDKYGPSELVKFMHYGSLKNWLGDKQNDEEFVKSISPYFRINSQTPPTYIIHGDADPTVEYEQSEILYAKLQEQNIKSQFTTVPDGGHGRFPAAYNTQMNTEIKEFLNQVQADLTGKKT